MSSIKGVTPEPDSTEDSEFMWDGITVEPPSPPIAPESSESLVARSLLLPHTQNASSLPSATSLSSREIGHRINCGDGRTMVPGLSQYAHSEVLEKVQHYCL